MSVHPTTLRLRTMREMTEYLRSDLYERIESPEGPETACWQSPLGWQVIFALRGDRSGYTAEIRQPDGGWLAATSYADINWLEEKLP